MENETITAKSKYIRQSPYKLRLVLNLIRGLPVSEALDILKFTKRKASDEITKVIQSAMANAENNFGLNSNDLYISQAIADEGPTLKRFRPRNHECSLFNLLHIRSITPIVMILITLDE